MDDEYDHEFLLCDTTAQKCVFSRDPNDHQSINICEERHMMNVLKKCRGR